MATAVVDTATGEVLDQADPETLDDVNHRINLFLWHLSQVSKEVMSTRRQLLAVSTAYKPYRAGLIKASHEGEAKQREADADITLYATPAFQLVTAEAMEKSGLKLDGDESIAAAKDRLEMDVKILSGRGHDYRAALSSLQDVGNNLRAELKALGTMPS